MSRLIAVARGDAAPDLVIEGGRVFSAFTREWLEGDVAIAGGRIAGVEEIVGGSPTPRSPYGESGSPSSRISSRTGGMSSTVGIR